METQLSSNSLPIGRSDFRTLRAQGQLYIDKTMYLAQMARESPYVFLARPRRFGKTLFVSMAEQAFGGEKPLFADTSLASAQSWDWQERPVLRLDMSLVQDDSVPELKRSLNELVLDVRGRLLRPGHPVSRPQDLARRSPARTFLDLIVRLHDTHGQRVVVLIDEYDSPITHMLGRTHQYAHPERPIDKQGIMDVLRQFYGVLKAAESFLQFTFITGISRFARSGLFSALNNLADVSFDGRYGAVAGITEEELAQHLSTYIEKGAQHLDIPGEELRRRLREFYNGYRFGRNQEPVYNPFSLLGALSQLSDPVSAMDIAEWGLPSLWAESGAPHMLIRLLQTGRYSLSQWSDNPVQALRAAYDPESPSLEALLCQTGYLTLKEAPAGDLILASPNLEVGQSFVTSVLQGFLRTPDDFARQIGERRRRLQDALAQQNWQGFFQEIDSVFHESIPYALLRVENNYHVVFHLICALLQIGRVSSEVQTARGRADMILDWPTGAYGLTAHQVILFELKVNVSPLSALDQISEQEYWTKLMRHELPVYGMGVSFHPQRPAGELVCDWTEPYLFHNPALSATRREVRDAYLQWRHASGPHPSDL